MEEIKLIDSTFKKLDSDIKNIESRIKSRQYDEIVEQDLSKLIYIGKYILDNHLENFYLSYIQVLDKYKKEIANPNKMNMSKISDVRKLIDNLERVLVNETNMLAYSIQKQSIEIKSNKVADKPLNDEIKTFELINNFNTIMQDLHFLGNQLVGISQSWSNKNDMNKVSDAYADIYSLVNDFSKILPNIENLGGANAQNIQELPNEEKIAIKSIIKSVENFIRTIYIIVHNKSTGLTKENLNMLESAYNKVKESISSYPEKLPNFEF